MTSARFAEIERIPEFCVGKGRDRCAFTNVGTTGGRGLGAGAADGGDDGSRCLGTVRRCWPGGMCAARRSVRL